VHRDITSYLFYDVLERVWKFILPTKCETHLAKSDLQAHSRRYRQMD